MALKLVGSERWMEEQCWSGMKLLNNGDGKGGATVEGSSIIYSILVWFAQCLDDVSSSYVEPLRGRSFLISILMIFYVSEKSRPSESC